MLLEMLYENSSLRFYALQFKILMLFLSLSINYLPVTSVHVLHEDSHVYPGGRVPVGVVVPLLWTLITMSVTVTVLSGGPGVVPHILEGC